MAIRSLGLAAAMAVATNAFLVTPDMIPQPDMMKWSVVDPNTSLLVVPCQGCSVDGLAPDVSMLLNLTVGNVPGTIELNGEVVYPLNPFSMARNPKVLLVPSVSAAEIVPNIAKYRENEDVISGWLFGASAERVSKIGDEIVSLNVDIQSIGSKHVHVPHVEYKILKNAENYMMILSSEFAASKVGQADSVRCTGRACSLREMIADRLHSISAALPKAFKGACHKGKGRMPNMSHMNMNGHSWLPLDQSQPYHHDHHHHHHRHHHHGLRTFFVGLWHVVRDFGLPILLGLVAGVLAYGLGMAIGCSVILLWIRLRRGRDGGAGYGRVALGEDDAARKELDVEAAARDSFESAPPLYEHAPEYEEKAQPQA